MATIIQAKRYVYDLLKDADVEGGVYIDKRPSIDEDIVVNAITTDSNFWQSTIINVNCYVPDLEIKHEGREITVPNIARLEEIAEDVYDIVKSNSMSQKFRLYTESMQQLEEIEERSHYINFRIRIFVKNK